MLIEMLRLAALNVRALHADRERVAARRRVPATPQNERKRHEQASIRKSSRQQNGTQETKTKSKKKKKK